MPPKNKPQITDDELTILEWWVNQQAPEGKKISDMQVPADVLKAMGNKNSEAKREGSSESKSKTSKKERTSEQIAQMNEVLEKYPHAISWTSREQPTMQFTAASMRKSFQDQDIANLADVAPHIELLDLNGTKISDKIANLIKETPHLKNTEN